MIETFAIQSRIAQQIENELISSFFEAFGENFKDCAPEVVRGVCLLPPEANTVFAEEYKYHDVLFLKVRVVCSYDGNKVEYIVKFNRYKKDENH